MTNTVVGNIYWNDGRILKRKRKIFCYNEYQGHLKDGRPVEYKDGKWTYTPE